MSNNIDCPHNQINRSGGYESGFITHIYWLNKFTSNRIFNKCKGMFVEKIENAMKERNAATSECFSIT